MVVRLFKKVYNAVLCKLKHKQRFLLAEKPPWTKWHSACMLIASLVGGEDLVVVSCSKIVIKTPASTVTKISVNGDGRYISTQFLASESDTYSACQVTFPAVFTVDDVGKDLAWWSEKQAMAVAKIVWLNDHKDNIVYGLGSFVPGQYRARIEVSKRLPQVNSEEELMMRATIAFGDAGNLEM